MQLLQNKIVTKEIMEDKIPPYIRVQRHIVSVNFYLTVQISGEIYLVLMDYSPIWGCWYPFYYNPLSKEINHFSSERTYQALIEENRRYTNINLSRAVTKAINKFKDRIGTVDFLIEPLRFSLREYELKYSKTKNRYTMYRFLNFIITDISNPELILKQDVGTYKLVKLSEVCSTENIVSNAYYVVEKNMEQLKQCAIIIDV